MDELASLLCTLGNSDALLSHAALLLPRWMELCLLHLLIDRILGLLFHMNAMLLLFDRSSLLCMLCSRRRVVSWAQTSSAFRAVSGTGAAGGSPRHRHGMHLPRASGVALTRAFLYQVLSLRTVSAV